ncbi:MAG: tetratricopeptide repeat protein [Bacteroidota bacterium]
MKKIFAILLLLGLVPSSGLVQSVAAFRFTRGNSAHSADSLLAELLQQSHRLFNQKPDSGRQLALQAIALASQRQDLKNQGRAFLMLGLSERGLGNIPAAKTAYLTGLRLFRQYGDSVLVAEALISVGRILQAEGEYPDALQRQIQAQELLLQHEASPNNMATSYGSIGNLYRLSKDYEKAEEFFLKALDIRLKFPEAKGIGFSYNSLGLLYYDLEKYQLALSYFDKALLAFQQIGNRQFVEVTYRNMGNCHTAVRNFEQARSYYQQALLIATEMNSKEKKLRLNYRLGGLFEKQALYERAVDYYSKSLRLAQEIGKIISVQEAYMRLSECYAKLGKYQEAFQAYRGYTSSKDILFNEKSDQKLAELKTQYETQQKEQAIDVLNEQRKYLLIGLGLFSLLTVLLLRTIQLRRRANRQLLQSKRETEKVLQDKEHLLKELQSTQTQLIQAEKMASLGQLTAGIAHEINNPINFIVSNVKALRLDFEDISVILQLIFKLPEKPTEEQIQELTQKCVELDIPFIYEEVGQLIGGIERGADRTGKIIEGLKTFSRSKGDQFEKADIHKGIDSTLVILGNKIGSKIKVEKTYSDLPLVECQIGKLNQVFMNILNNAVQAIQDNDPPEGSIHISTQHKDEKVFIGIRDTGKGMTTKTIEKIFDPFFTTKEIGKGTGLGLAISYGIIADHNGQIEVESTPGKGTSFQIILPLEYKQVP